MIASCTRREIRHYGVELELESGNKGGCQNLIHGKIKDTELSIRYYNYTAFIGNLIGYK